MLYLKQRYQRGHNHYRNTRLERKHYQRTCDIARRHINQQECAYLTAFVPYRRSRGTEPAVLLGLIYIVKHSFAVPVQEFVHSHFRNRLPFTRHQPVLNVGIRVNDIYHGTGLPVIHCYVNIVNIIGMNELVEHFQQSRVFFAVLCRVKP